MELNKRGILKKGYYNDQNNRAENIPEQTDDESEDESNYFLNEHKLVEERLIKLKNEIAFKRENKHDFRANSEVLFKKQISHEDFSMNDRDNTQKTYLSKPTYKEILVTHHK